jgi:hypothetical protein
MIQNTRGSNVNARKFFRLVLKSCNFIPKIKLYWFLIYKPILHFSWFHISIHFMLLLVLCHNPNLAKCGGEAQHLEKLGDLESSGTPECLELDRKGQKTSHWGVLSVIGKVLKRRYRKCPRIGNSDIFSPSYGQKKGRESNWQFDSRPLKVGNRCLPDVRFECATWSWKDLDKGYNFGWDLVAIQLCSRELWRFKVLGVPLRQFRDSISGVPGICAIWIWSPRRAAENTIGSKVVAYSRVRAVVSLVCPSAHGKSQHARVSRMLN